MKPTVPAATTFAAPIRGWERHANPAGTAGPTADNCSENFRLAVALGTDVERSLSVAWGGISFQVNPSYGDIMFG